MDYEDEMLDYEYDAEDSFDDFDDEDDFDSGLDGLEDNYDDDDFDDEMEYVEMDEDYDDYKSSSIGKIDSNDRTLTVVVSNTSGAPQNVVVFGAFEGVQPPAGVTIEVAESSHNFVRQESISNPFLIESMRMSVSSPLQFDNVLNIVNKTATGNDNRRVFQPRNATSPQNFTANLIQTKFEMAISGRDSLEFLMNEGTTVFTFNIKARANIGNLLKGKNVAELSTAPVITGIPQLDFARKQRTSAFGLKPKSKRRAVRRYKRRPTKRRTGLRTRARRFLKRR